MTSAILHYGKHFSNLALQDWESRRFAYSILRSYPASLCFQVYALMKTAAASFNVVRLGFHAGLSILTWQITPGFLLAKALVIENIKQVALASIGTVFPGIPTNYL